MIHLSKRLMAVASMVTPGSHAADIGCDHGYIPIYLIQKGIAVHVLAMDINTGPLSRAQSNIDNWGLSEKIDTRLSDGLSQYKQQEADSLIIAGMGGLMICDILDAGKTRGVLGDFRELILSPHSDIEKVRKHLHKLEFKIDKETMVIDAGKYYTVIHAIKGRENYNNQEDYVYGKYLIDHRHPVLKNYVTDTLKQKEDLYKKISGYSTPGARDYAPRLYKEIQNLKNVQLRMQTGGWQS